MFSFSVLRGSARVSVTVLKKLSSVLVALLASGGMFSFCGLFVGVMSLSTDFAASLNAGVRGCDASVNIS